MVFHKISGIWFTRESDNSCIWIPPRRDFEIFIRLALFDSLESPTIAVFGFHRDFETIVFFFSCFDVIHDFTDHVSEKKIRQCPNVPFFHFSRSSLPQVHVFFRAQEKTSSLRKYTKNVIIGENREHFFYHSVRRKLMETFLSFILASSWFFSRSGKNFFAWEKY